MCIRQALNSISERPLAMPHSTHSATAAQAAAILTARFDQERRWDWKVELHRRRSEHQAATEALQVRTA